VKTNYACAGHPLRAVQTAGLCGLLLLLLHCCAAGRHLCLRVAPFFLSHDLPRPPLMLVPMLALAVTELN
jgi:hypothetical protein